jgi:excisionase family DNA binding protein
LNYPKLRGWLTVTEVAGMLNLSRQTVHKMIIAGNFTTVNYVGSADKPVYLINVLDSLLQSKEVNK